MSDLKAIAIARSVDTIRGLAQTVRDGLGYRDLAQIQPEHLVESALPVVLPSFVYDIKPRSRMHGAEGFAVPDRDYIAIREDVYQAARMGNGRARFTIAHELGHLLLHQSEHLVFERSERTTAKFRQPEWQADIFAAEFLMDLRKIRRDDNDVAIRQRFGVSITAARHRLAYIKRAGLTEELQEPTRWYPAGS